MKGTYLAVAGRIRRERDELPPTLEAVSHELHAFADTLEQIAEE